MGLFDIFTTDAQDKARDDQVAGIRAGMAQYGDLAGQGRGALTDQYGRAISGIADTYGAGRGAIGEGIGALGTNYGQAISSLTGAYGAGISGLGNAYNLGAAPLQQNFGTATAGLGAYGDALGINGPAGNARATAGFWNNPAIQSQLDIGSENVLRNQARTGQLASGATNIDLQNLGQQVASQGWQNYVQNLSPYINFAQNSASGLGNLYSGYGNQLANTYANLGNQQGGLYAGLGQQLAGQYGNLNTNWMGQGNAQAPLYTGLGTNLANSFQNQGNVAYGGQTSIGNANANADLASLQASGNIWNAAMGVAGLAAGGAGGGGFGGLMKTAGNVAGSFANPGTAWGNLSGGFTGAYNNPWGQQVASRAEGGPVSAGQPTIVGERGPELVVPQRDGVVIPNEALTERGMNDYVNRDPRLYGARIRSILDAIQGGDLGGGAKRANPVSPGPSRESAVMQDSAENVLGQHQVMLPTAVRRAFGGEPSMAQRIAEAFLAARGGGNWMPGRGTRFSPMSYSAAR